jgi:hypothetical protein
VYQDRRRLPKRVQVLWRLLSASAPAAGALLPAAAPLRHQVPTCHSKWRAPRRTLRDTVGLGAGPGLQPAAGHITTAVRLAPRRRFVPAVGGGGSWGASVLGAGRRAQPRLPHQEPT